MTISKMERGRRALKRQELPHTVLAHPLVAVLGQIGLVRLAQAIHYHSLPVRARRRWRYEDVLFKPERRLFLWDAVVTPVASVLRAFGHYRGANDVARRFDWQSAKALGGCGYSDFQAAGIRTYSPALHPYDAARYLAMPEYADVLHDLEQQFGLVLPSPSISLEARRNAWNALLGPLGGEPLAKAMWSYLATEYQATKPIKRGGRR